VQLRPALVGPAADLAMSAASGLENDSGATAASCVCIQNSICLIAIGALASKGHHLQQSQLPRRVDVRLRVQRTVQGRVQISPVARYRSKRPLAPRGRASGRKYWAGGPSSGPDFTTQQSSLTRHSTSIRLIDDPHFVNGMRGKIGTRQQSAAPGEKAQWCSSWCELVESASLSRGVTCHSEFESG